MPKPLSVLATLLSLVCLATVAFAGPVAGASPDVSARQLLHGKFVVVAADAAGGESTAYFVKVRGRLYRLEGKQHYRFKTGQPVTVSGTVDGETVEAPTVAADGPAPASIVAPASARVLVELVYWTSPDSTVTPADAQRQYAETSNEWFQTDSYGAFAGMTADATEWMPIAAPTDPDEGGTSTPCDNIGEIQAAGDAAAQAAGHDLSGYTNFVYYYPTCPDEMWGGWGEVGSNHTWLIGEMSTRVSVHELGHNFGLGHSRAHYCTQSGVQVTSSPTCEVVEYGDPTSAMGGGGSGQGMFSANQQAYLGWLGNETHSITDVDASGTFTLAPVESQAGGAQALRVVDSSGTKFWIEYRQPQGVDAFLWEGLTNGVLIKSGPDDVSYAESALYDMTPSAFGDFSDAALAVGRSWSNPLGDLHVRVESANVSGATVSVQLGNPTLSVVRTGKGSGTVTSTPAGIDCGDSCLANYAPGTQVTLTATAVPGSAFSGWSGGCTGTAPCTVAMTAPQSVTAEFGGPACTIRGTTGPDVLTGTPGDDVICGGGGNDTLAGRGGDDTLIGDGGNDALWGHQGNDTLLGVGGNDTMGGGGGNDSLDGGSGTDTAYFGDAPAVAVNLTTGSATGEGADALTALENVTGSTGNDRITGSTAVNVLQGLGGNDALLGQSGNDTLYGAGGRDALTGGVGADTCNGGTGTDTATTCETRVSVP